MSASPEILYARNGLPQLASRLATLGVRRVLVLTSPSRRHVDDVLHALSAFAPVVFDGAKVHVPVEVVEAATQALADARADAVVALGGGSAIGLGKALRLGHSIRFAAIPTTYAGSEMTNLYGSTRAGEKTTGRDDRVRPDIVLYDASLHASLPLGLTIQSLLNALAHVVGVLSTNSLVGDDRGRALDAAAALARAMEDLLIAPAAEPAREAAMRAAAAAGQAIDRGKLGVQHAIAHYLGGATGIDHAPLHSVLLPQSVALLREEQPALVAELERVTGWMDLEPALHDLLTRAGAPTSLAALGVDAEAAQRLAAARPDVPARLILDAELGLRPTGRGGRIALGPGPAALLAGPPLAQARRIVVALHGRGAEAGSIVRRYSALAGGDAETSIVGLQSGRDRWYTIKYGAAGAGSDAEVTAAIAQVEAALAALPAGKTILLAGFSQGACLALEVAARHAGAPALAAVLAPCGARIGSPSEWASPTPGRCAGVAVLLGAAASDPYVDSARIEATAAWFRAAGASVDVIGDPGDRHDISTRQRLRGRELVLGTSPRGPTGFGGALESEAVPGALPRHQNSPRQAPFGLYAEQISGTAFTAPRADNRRTWCYRVRPSTQRRAYVPFAHPRFGAVFAGRAPEINLTGFAPLGPPAEPRDFIDGLETLGGGGDPASRRGYAIHRYAANRDMERRALVNADGDLLLVPEHGALTLMTELGPLAVAPGEIALVPSGVAFSILLHGGEARGTVAEAFGGPFRLPERGPAGANGLADARHFRAPAAFYEDRLAPDFRIVTKMGGVLYQASQDHSPFDVVAWHGNHVPYVYDLADFSPLGSVRFDHPDPSIFTVLSAPGLDFIVFAPRWEVAEHTFRPPFFHRSVISEVNGIIRERAHPGSPFQPGLLFLTPALTPHGTGGSSVERILAQSDADADRPTPPGDGLWYQFEAALPMSLTPWAESARLASWAATWSSHRGHFKIE